MCRRSRSSDEVIGIWGCGRGAAPPTPPSRIRSTRMSQNAALGPDMSRYQRIALIAGVVALILCAVGAFLDPAAFFQAYLVAFLYWLAFPLGALLVVAIYHLGGGVWGFPIRRPLEAAMVTIP